MKFVFQVSIQLNECRLIFYRFSTLGGLCETADDGDIVQTALRETEEEIGLPSSSVNVWTSQKSVVYPNGKSSITSVIGCISELDIDQLKLNPDEVDRVIVVPLKDLFEPCNQGYTQFRGQAVENTGNHPVGQLHRPGYSVPLYDLPNQTKIWGLTGAITYQFLLAFNLASQYSVNQLKYPHNIGFVQPVVDTLKWTTS